MGAGGSCVLAGCVHPTDSDAGGASIYVQLLADRQLDSRAYRRGDWVDVGKQTALLWISQRVAVARGTQKVAIDADCGILTRGDTTAVESWLGRYGVTCNLASAGSPVTLPWPRTLIWQPDSKLRVDLLPAGFGFLTRWEVAVPLFDHQTLAGEVGNQADRARTEAICHDLRVPLYDPGVLFLRRCEAVERLLAAWRIEGVGDERLALLRAIYRVKPLILALPATWVQA